MCSYYPFFTKTNNAKPVTINKESANRLSPCPFCDYALLSKNQEVLKDMGTSLLVTNLYTTIGQTIQTVFIETNECDASFLDYKKETALLVMRNFLDSYRFLCNKYPDKYIIGFKNAGPFSSGSIHHQHMQLLALDHPLKPKGLHIFEGPLVWKEDSIQVNFSDKPVTEFYEINLAIATKDLFSYEKTFERFCLLLQGCIQFVLSTITTTNSYNLAFYFEEEICTIKILPRVLKSSVSYSPLLLAFDMHLVPDNLEHYCTELMEKLKKYNDHCIFFLGLLVLCLLFDANEFTEFSLHFPFHSNRRIFTLAFCMKLH